MTGYFQSLIVCAVWCRRNLFGYSCRNSNAARTSKLVPRSCVSKHTPVPTVQGLGEAVAIPGAGAANFSFRECVDKLDGPRTELALRIVSRYARGSTEKEKEQLLALGNWVGQRFPQLQDLAQATREAKERERWRADREKAQR